MKSTFSLIRDSNLLKMILAVLVGVLFVVGGVSAATTISTNISTGGTLSVTGASTLTGLTSMIQASSTRFSVHDTAYFGGTATTTINSTGVITLRNGETIANATDGDITLTATNLVLVGTASTSAVKVGDEPNATTINGMVTGYCTFPTVTITASTTGMASCAGATGVVSGDRIFVQATSSLPDVFVIQAASSTATDVIQVDITNLGFTVTTATGINSLNFWAVR
ncbi:hypothetical protein C4556_03085 [Candidatus Parcubacteria bacterium]|nr:MAG: hypothetical protein C4556_03085 [Candidatus Parcubacteria bacterium]